MNEKDSPVAPISVAGSQPGLARSPVADEDNPPAAEETCQVCYWNGQAYSRGARICNQDTSPNELLECRNMNGIMLWVRRGLC